MTYVIEFRSGTYFQNIDADRGGAMATAQKFESTEAADAMMDLHEWIKLAGGMVVPFREGR